MSLARVQQISISLDGFGTGEGQSLESPFGHAGERMHEWMFARRRQSPWDRRFVRVRGWRITDLDNTGLRTGEAHSSRGERPGFHNDTPSISLGSTTTGEPFAGISGSLQTVTGLALGVKSLRSSMAPSTQHAMA